MSENNKNWLGQTEEPKIETPQNPTPQTTSTNFINLNEQPGHAGTFVQATDINHSQTAQNFQNPPITPIQTQISHSQATHTNIPQPQILQNHQDTTILRNKATEGWSWGGSFTTTFTFIVGKNWGLLILNFVLLFIPLINLISIIGFFIYGGLSGKQLVYDSNRFSNHDEKIGAIKSIEAVGFVIFIIWIVGIVGSFMLA